MSPRPRRTTDEELIAATHRVVAQRGPHLTLADVAREAGVSPATLVQRFGSKRDLLLTLASGAAEGTRRQFAAIRQAHPNALNAVHELVRCYSQMAPTPEAVSNVLAFLQVDLSDPEFHGFAHAQTRAAVGALETLLEHAVKARQLAPCDTERLAFALHATIGGAMVTWAVLREGTAEEAIRAAVETVLEPRLKRRRTAALTKRRIRR